MTDSSPGISAIILAAGMSKRMGAPKQLLRLAGATLLEHALNNVRQSRAQEIILVLGHEAEAIRQQMPLDNVKVIVNPNYQEGMGVSLRMGLSAIAPESRGAMIVLADQPLVRPATLDILIERHRELNPQIVIPVYRGFRGNPVLLDRSVFPELSALTGETGCRAIFGDHTESILMAEVDDVGILLDVDSQYDLKKLSAGGPAERPLLEFAGGPRNAAGGQQELVIVGRDSFAHALAAMARLLRYAVTVVDPLLAPEEFPEADCLLHVLDFSKLPAAAERHVVVASRGQFDEDALEQALACGAAYVALVANRKRGQEIQRHLRAKGIPQEKLAQVRAPAGLEIGAESPEEIALSIMAEMVAARPPRKR
ncbi:MAG TPA: NTP transferase domain-containing protein [Candidatus Saccharimonadales bacterium]|jgi:molybdenum cofactor cytidylyltransferase|nr:NTP transferase domain-containing protein [Candidatus Saccharimonadales bacterium]